MRDVIVIAIVLGFFALAVGYVGWCERIIANGASGSRAEEPGVADASPDRAVAESDDTGVVAAEARR